MMSTDLPTTLSKKPTPWKMPIRKNLKCILASFALIFFIIVIIVIVTILFSYTTKQNNENTIPPEYYSNNKTVINENIIARNEWQSQKLNENIPKLKQPVKYVVICHTVGRFCETFDNCSFVLRWMQNRSLYELKQLDIPYNFLIGGDGNVYEGRGWNHQNVLRLKQNSIALAYIGNYVFYDFLTENMIHATNGLLSSGVENGYLEENYLLLPQNHTAMTMSPGENIYKEIKKWEHFSSIIIV